MHDPMSVAFEVKYPWKVKGSKYRDPFITIWHNDPCTDGSDDSCDWSGRKRKLNPQEKELYKRIDNLLHTLGNHPYYPDPKLYGIDPHGFSDDAESGPIRKLQTALWEWKRRRGFRIHPRWHIWHWSLQIHPLEQFKRWAFSKCCKCGKGFAWGYSPCTDSWHGSGPLWFRSEKSIYHADCRRPDFEGAYAAIKGEQDAKLAQIKAEIAAGQDAVQN